MCVSVYKIGFLDTCKIFQFKLKSDSKVSEYNTANHITFINNNGVFFILWSSWSHLIKISDNHSPSDLSSFSDFHPTKANWNLKS